LMVALSSWYCWATATTTFGMPIFLCAAGFFDEVVDYSKKWCMTESCCLMSHICATCLP
jgi:hypothetical protein